MAGLGKLSPNMMMIGFKEMWWTSPDDADDYVRTLQAAFDLHMSVGVLRLQGGLDLSSMGSTKVRSILCDPSSNMDPISWKILHSHAMHSDWLKIVMWLGTSNWSAQFQYSIVKQHWNLFMTLAPGLIISFRFVGPPKTSLKIPWYLHWWVNLLQA